LIVTPNAAADAAAVTATVTVLRKTATSTEGKAELDDARKQRWSGG